MGDMMKVLAGVGAAGCVNRNFGVSEILADGKTRVKRPNIILLLADDLGYGDVGSYGCPDIKTPNIDRMAREGIRFTDAYANSPLCSPTRAAFVTGRYQQRLGYECEDYMGGGNPGLKANEHPSIAMYLKKAGYKTACYGKWNVGGVPNYTPNDHGFDHWVGLHHNFNYFTHRAQNDPNGPSRLYEDGRVIEKSGRYITDLLADLTIKYIENSGDEPFFLYVPWQAPHNPMQAPDDDPNAKILPMTPEVRRVKYIKIVENMDTQTGRIMDAIKRKGIDENTLVIFTSDNGGQKASRNLPLKGGKQDLDEGGIRVPFIMRQPGTIAQGQVTEQPTITFDVTATIVELAGATVPKEHALDGINLMPYVTGQKAPDKNRTLYWRRLTNKCRQRKFTLRARAIREGDWKYLDDAVRNAEHLYNLKEDIGETNNLIKAKLQLAARLKKKLHDWEMKVTPKEQPFFSSPPEKRRKKGGKKRKISKVK